MYDLVAATLISLPAWSGRKVSTSSASGESAVLTKATVRAPPCFAARIAERMSGLLPDCEIPIASMPVRSAAAP
jgi:hypothetical protein